MAPFNPGRLKDISRYVEPQAIVPGGSRYDYGYPAGSDGRNVPAVGNYPSGAPGGLSARLGDGAVTASPLMTWTVGLIAFAALAGLAYLGDKRGR